MDKVGTFLLGFLVCAWLGINIADIGNFIKGIPSPDTIKNELKKN
jgi:hypothetical protein